MTGHGRRLENSLVRAGQVVDLRTLEVTGSVDTLEDAGYNPNSLALLPERNDTAGH